MPQSLSRRHAIAFLISHTLIVAIRHYDLPLWLWLVALMIFFFAEIYGGITGTEEHITTWSHVVWDFLEGGCVRMYVVLGWLAWVGLGLVDTFGTPLSSPVPNVPFAEFCLLTGVVIWLIPHLLFRGKHCG